MLHRPHGRLELRGAGRSNHSISRMRLCLAQSTQLTCCTLSTRALFVPRTLKRMRWYAMDWLQ